MPLEKCPKCGKFHYSREACPALKSQPKHVHEKRATVDGDVMVEAPAASKPKLTAKPPKAHPAPTRKRLMKIAEERIKTKEGGRVDRSRRVNGPNGALVNSEPASVTPAVPPRTEAATRKDAAAPAPKPKDTRKRTGDRHREGYWADYKRNQRAKAKPK